MELGRCYTDEEKRQLLANLDIEVAHRSRQLKAELEIKLETFGLHQLAQISRIPKQIRNMTIREFGEKYEGNLQSALRGYQKERLAAAGIDASVGEIDRSERKRKWVAIQEAEADMSAIKDSDSQRSNKTARTNLLSPKKAQGSTNAHNTPRPQTKATVHQTPRFVPPPPSPQKRPFSNIPNPSTSQLRPPSPSKAQLSRQNVGPSNQKHPIPSSLHFNPTLPPKTPSLPSRNNGAMRLPRKDENLLSINGSPLANPYEFGLGWFRGIESQSQEDSQDSQAELSPGRRMLKRSKSSIVIRRDASVAFPTGLDGTYSRTDSQLSFYTASSQTTSSSHSRENSQTSQLLPVSTTNQLGSFRFPSSQPIPSDVTPRPLAKHTRSFSALVAIPTKDGHVLEFDPLQTSPGNLDTLEGISDSAKKQAKQEMGRLIQATVEKWKMR